jgi:hypothetical protein
MRWIISFILLFWAITAQAQTPDKQGWIPLFNGKNLDGWYSFLMPGGKNNDPKGIFKVENGMIHILGVSEAVQRGSPDGYLSTNREYSDVRIHLEYKWGTRRFAPNAEGKRNSGLIYLMQGPDKVYPPAVECQIEESDVGDIWLIEGVSAMSWVVDIATSLYSDDNSFPGVLRMFGGPGTTVARILKSGDFEDRSGWNTVEVVLEGDRATHIVNGRIVNRAVQLRQPDPQAPHRMIELRKGRIALEAEGAEIWFRNIKIRPLQAD